MHKCLSNYLFGSALMPFMAPEGVGGGGSDDSDYDDDGISDDDFVQGITDALGDEDDDDIDDDNDDEAEEESGEEDPGPEEESRTFSQAELDRIIGERLARDRSTREEQTQQQAAQLAQQMFQQQQAQQQQSQQQAQQQQIYQQELERRAEMKVETYGFDEETARRESEREMQTEIRLAMMEQQFMAQRQMGETNRTINQYMADRNDILGKNPLAAKYIDEIDSVSRGGTATDFNTAMNYVLGQHLTSGDLMRSLQEATEQKTLKNVSARQKIGAEKGGSGGGSGSSTGLTREQRMVAKALGVSDKAYAKNLTKKK